MAYIMRGKTCIPLLAKNRFSYHQQFWVCRYRLTLECVHALVQSNINDEAGSRNSAMSHINEFELYNANTVETFNVMKLERYALKLLNYTRSFLGASIFDQLRKLSRGADGCVSQV